MLTYKGGQMVGKGTYRDLTNGRWIDVPSDAVLAGETAMYVKMPSGLD